MQVPTITAGYLGILALLYALLSIRVVLLRGKYQVSLGDGGNAALTSAPSGRTRISPNMSRSSH